jgi:hypothetical protein
LCCSIIIPSTSRIVESKSIPTVCFSGAAGCAVPSLSQVQVGVESKVSQQFTFWLRFAVPSLSQVQVELLKVKVSQQFTFVGSVGLAVHHYPNVQVELLKVSIPTVSFSGAAGCAVPSLSQVQVELLKVKVSQQFAFLVLVVPFHHYPSTSRIVESKSIPTVHFFWCCRLCGSIIIPSTG